MSLALCGIANAPVRLREVEIALTGKRLDVATLRSALKSLDGLDATSDIHATPEYRRHLAAVLVTRALRDAAAVCGIKL